MTPGFVPHACHKSPLWQNNSCYHLQSVTPEHESASTIKHCIWLHTKYCTSLATKNDKEHVVTTWCKQLCVSQLDIIALVVVVVGRSWQATNVPQHAGLLYRPLFWTFQSPAYAMPPRTYRRVPHSSGGSWNVPTSPTRCPHAYRRVPHSSSGSWNYYERE
jgi:hypothetical protein